MFFRILKQIRKNGYAVSDGEYRKGVCAIAVPVLNSKGVLGGVNYRPLSGRLGFFPTLSG